MQDLSVRKFADRLGVPQTTVQQYLKGRMPPADFIVLVCERFAIDPWWLLTGNSKVPERSITSRVVALADNCEALSEEDVGFVERIVSTLVQSQVIVKKNDRKKRITRNKES